MNQAPEHGPSVLFPHLFSADIFLLTTVPKPLCVFVLPILCQIQVFVFQLNYLSMFFCDCVTYLHVTLCNFSVLHTIQYSGLSSISPSIMTMVFLVMEQADTVMAELKLRI